MKKGLSIALAAFLALPLTASLAACGNGSDIVPKDMGNWTVSSPDASLRVAVTMDAQGQLSYSVNKDETAVLEESALGMRIEEDDFDLLTLANVGQRRVTGSYENTSGRASEVSYDCNELTLTFKGWEYYFDVIMRAYDDGYAFRYAIRSIDGESKTVTVVEEKSEFALPGSTTLWAQQYRSIIPESGNFFSYESAYDRRSSANLTEEYLAMPLMYRVSGTQLYSIITESDLIGSGYYGSMLRVPADKQGTNTLQTFHSPAGCTIDDNKVDAPFTSPWRVGIVGTMKEVNESELVEKVYDDAEYWRPDNYDSLSAEEQAIYDYDWVESGVAAWSWLSEDRGQNNYTMHEEYLNLAATMGWKYLILDADWDSSLNVANFKAFTQKAHDMGVKIIVWCNALNGFANGNRDVLQLKLDQYWEYGIDGIKIDFFDGQNATDPTHYGEDIETIKWYEAIYQETAMRKMVVVCHGSNKPTGERRVYPNVLSREAVMGNEFTSVGSAFTVNSMFIRTVVGPTDFTPVVDPLSNGLTKTQQMALAVLYESGVNTMADVRSAYLDSEVRDFYMSVPALRDETLFLGGEPDSCYYAAVRVGDEWFVAGINGILSQTVTVDFSFLGDGEYEATVFTDAEEDARSVVKSQKTLTAASSEQIAMAANGGFVIRLTPRA